MPLALWAQSEQEGSAIVQGSPEVERQGPVQARPGKGPGKIPAGALRLQKNQSDKWTGNALLGIGRVYNRLGRYEDALKSYDKCLEIRKKLGDLKGEGVTLNNIGFV